MLEVTQQPRQSLFTWSGWRLEFGWQLDRWQHTLWQARPEGWQRRVASTEGTADQSWPDSPAFQNAYVERISDSCAEIQLLGQAGKNHYSGAVRCDAETQIIDFDLAVRIQAQHAAPLLLSSYQLFHPRGLSDFSTTWEMTMENLSQQPPSVAESATDPTGAGSTVRLLMPDLTEMRAEKLRATLRWKYQWRLKPVA
jgi:hypothetical protein